MLKKLFTEDSKTKLILTAFLMVLGFTYNWDLVNWPKRILLFPLIIFEGWGEFFMLLVFFGLIYIVLAILKYLIQSLSGNSAGSKQAWVILITTLAIVGSYYILNHQLIIYDLHNGPHSSEERYRAKSINDVTVDSLNYKQYVWEKKEARHEYYTIKEKTITFENDSTYILRIEQRSLDWFYLPRLLFDLNLKTGKRITILGSCEESKDIGFALCYRVHELGKVDTNQVVISYRIINEGYTLRLREQHYPGYVLVYHGAFWIYDNHLYSFTSFEDY